MTTKNYLVIQNNVVTNIVLWNGDTDTWVPPQGFIVLPQDTTPALTWVFDYTTNPYSSNLEQVVGAGQIGFTWNGSVLRTNVGNEPLPADDSALAAPATN